MGMSQNEVPLFPLKVAILEPKKGTSFRDIPIIYIYMYRCIGDNVGITTINQPPTHHR